MGSPTETRKWVIYDSRAAGGDTDSAAVMDLADSKTEARSSVRYYQGAAVAFSYRVAKGHKLVDEQGPFWFGVSHGK